MLVFYLQMAEEAETSLKNVEVEACCTKENGDSLGQNGGNKREHSDCKDDLDPPSDKSEHSDEEGNKKVKSENVKKDGETSVPCGSKGRRWKTFCRPVLIGSSSEAETDNTVCEKGVSSASDRRTSDTGDTLVPRSITTITSGAGSEMDDTSADTGRDTETDHVESASPSAMKTGSVASGSTDNDGTGKKILRLLLVVYTDKMWGMV